MSVVGFCLLTNVEGYDEESLLEAVKAFHDMPIKMKMKMAPKHYVPENENLY
jgi:hypothetical protein